MFNQSDRRTGFYDLSVTWFLMHEKKDGAGEPTVHKLASLDMSGDFN